MLMRGLTHLLMLFGLVSAYMGLWFWLPFGSKERLDLVSAMIFVVGGTLVFLAARWLDKKLPPEESKVFVLKRNDVRFIAGMVNRERRRNLLTGLFLLAFDALMILAIASGGGLEPEPAHPYPVVPKALEIGLLLIVAAAAIWFLNASFKLRNATNKLYNVLAKTPHLVTGLAVYFLRREGAPVDLGREILAELSIANETFRIAVSEKHFSLLKQYIELNSPRASYHEEEKSAWSR